MLSMAFHDVVYIAFGIQSLGNGSTEVLVCHQGVHIGVGTKHHVVDLGGVSGCQGHIGHSLHTGQVFHSDGGHQVSLAGLQTGEGSGFLGDDGVGHILDLSLLAPVLIVAGEHHIGAGYSAYKLVGAGAAGLYHQILVLLGSGGNDSRVHMGELCQEYAVGIAQVEYNGVLIGSFHALDGACQRGTGGAEIGVLDAVEGVDDSVSIEGSAIMEGNTGTQLDRYSLAVLGILRQALCQQGSEAAIVLQAVKGLIELVVDAGRNTIVGAQRVKTGVVGGHDNIEHLVPGSTGSGGVVTSGAGGQSQGHRGSHQGSQPSSERFFHWVSLLFCGLFIVVVCRAVRGERIAQGKQMMHQSRRLGSRISRSLSPRMLKQMTVIITATPGMMMSSGASHMKPLPVAIMLPHSGAGAGTPIPR